MTFLLVISGIKKVSFLPEPFIYALLHGMNTILRMFVLNHFCCSQECMQNHEYRKIPKISPGAYIFQRPFLRGLYFEGLFYGRKFAF